MATWTPTIDSEYMDFIKAAGRTAFPTAHRHEDCTPGPVGPLVSPTVSALVTGVLDIYPQYGDQFLYVKCTTAAITCGSGTLAGTAGNGYYTALQNEWVQIPVWRIGRDHGYVRVITAAAAGTVEFFFDTLHAL
jgi:hypothetical protein